MFLNILKKEITQFRRNTGSLIMMFLFPVVLITILGFALNSMMSGEINLFDDGKVIYTIEDKSPYTDGFNSLIDIFEDEFEGLTFEESTDLEESKEKVLNNDAYSYITIDKDGFSYFRNPNSEGTQSKVFRSIFEGVINKYKLIDVVSKNNPSLIKDIVNDETKKFTKELSVGSRAVSSIDYYTFAELALIILYISSIVGESVCKEKEESTINRVIISKTNPLKLLLAKITLGVLIGTAQIITVYLYSTFALDAKWGDNILPMIANLLALTIFSAVLGAFLGSIIRDSKSLNGNLNMIIIFIGLLGGCYTPLSMIKSIPIIGSLTVISPIYWVNSALISLSTGVSDSYSIIGISICLGISALLILIYFIKSNNTRGINHA